MHFPCKYNHIECIYIYTVTQIVNPILLDESAILTSTTAKKSVGTYIHDWRWDVDLCLPESKCVDFNIITLHHWCTLNAEKIHHFAEDN